MHHGSLITNNLTDRIEVLLPTTVEKTVRWTVVTWRLYGGRPSDGASGGYAEGAVERVDVHVPAHQLREPLQLRRVVEPRAG